MKVGILRFACGLLFGLFGVGMLWAQTPNAAMDPDAWVSRWASQYQSAEFAPLNRDLIYPTSEPNISQKSNSVKPSKMERELLAVWRKVWSDHFKSMPKELTPIQQQLVQRFQMQIDATYQQLIERELNYASANRELAQAYTEFSAMSQTELERIAQEKAKLEAKRVNQAVPSDSELQRYVQSAQKIYLMPPPDKKPSEGLTDLQIRIKDSCKTEKIKLEQLRQEQQDWAEVTTSVNDMLHDPYERERAQIRQREQAQQRESQIVTIQKFMDKNCHP